MTDSILSAQELGALVERVFRPTHDERSLAVLVDLPCSELVDNPEWKLRRELAAGWVRELCAAPPTGGLHVDLCVYRNVRANNADLPERGWIHPPEALPDHFEALDPHDAVPLEQIFTDHHLVIAPTELSATAPLKVLAPRFGFRAATMPGFSPEMIPALRLDYGEVNRRVALLKELLDRSNACRIEFSIDHRDELVLDLDLRHRSAHASGGLLPAPGTAGNLPSGEAYIVPYEGEIDGDPSATAGRLPVQFGDEVVVFEVADNRAIRVLSDGPASDQQAKRLLEEPAYGNLAELGLGVLGDFGITPIGEVLLDEKLGLHIAFGRSEHFGGQVGPAQFSRPEAVVHQDHVYIEHLQPRIVVKRADLTLDDGSTRELMLEGRYAIDFS